MPTKGDLTFVKLPNKVKKANFQMPPEGNHPRPNINAWKILNSPAWVDYQKVTVKNLDKQGPWPSTAALVEKNKNGMAEKWAYMVIDGGHQIETDPNGERTIPAAHPVGHNTPSPFLQPSVLTGVELVLYTDRLN